MNAKRVLRLAILSGVIGCLTCASATAGPFFGDGSWFWRPARDCPRGQYSPMHYWAPSAYQLRAQVHPSNLNQYPPGPSAGVPPSFAYECYRCPSLPPLPSLPYSNPEAYFGSQYYKLQP
jgi:hypothetical protein